MKTIYIFQNMPKDSDITAGIKCTNCLHTLKRATFMQHTESNKISNDLLSGFTLTRCPHCGQYLHNDTDFMSY